MYLLNWKGYMDNYERLLDGLLLYLQIRDWAFEKMKSHPVGAQAIDLEIHQYLYLSNALSATDLVGETLYGKDFRRPPYGTTFDRSLIEAFDMKVGTASQIRGQEAYAFVRELRNSVVHRGLGSATTSHSNQNFVLCSVSQYYNRFQRGEYLSLSLEVHGGPGRCFKCRLQHRDLLGARKT